MKVKLCCEYCGKEFLVSPCDAKPGKRRCCSKECTNKLKRNKAPWNKGLTKETDERVNKYAKTKKNKLFTKEHRLALSRAKLGKKSPRKGVTLSQETRKKISIANKGKLPWITGKHHTKEACLKMSMKRRGKTRSEESKRKSLETKRKNGTFVSSKAENEIKELLIKKFPNLKWQYKSEPYPFACDFYIPDLDLYIEYQGNWTHGGKPFTKTKEDLEKLNSWLEKAKNSHYYDSAINVWTKRDPMKRKIAKQNNLNWKEFFSKNEFLLWFSTI